MLALFLKIYVLVKDKLGWKTVMSTKVLLKMTKDTVQEFVNFQVELSIKENGGTISPKETEFFTLVKMKLWKVDSIKEWFQIANL
jgi:rRNA pseudouridine-1189 N-methylase Emg1 (Nep1/Mra1 family)